MTVRALVIKALGLDDDQDWRMILTEKLCLHKLEHEIHHAQEDFKEAFMRIIPNMVFIDWTIPGARQTGNQLAETLKAINPNCLIFMVTGWTKFEDLHYFVYNVGGFAWILKDENFDNEFSRHVERAIEYFEKYIRVNEGMRGLEIEIQNRDKKRLRRENINP